VKIGKRMWYVPRVAFEAWNGPIPEGMLVCHRCDNAACFNPNHLFIGTELDNTRDAVSKGRRYGWRGGTAHPNAKLSLGQRVSIRDEFMRGGITKAALARRYGVSATAVRHAIDPDEFARRMAAGSAHNKAVRAAKLAQMHGTPS